MDHAAVIRRTLFGRNPVSYTHLRTGWEEQLAGHERAIRNATRHVEEVESGHKRIASEIKMCIRDSCKTFPYCQMSILFRDTVSETSSPNFIS